MLSPTLVLSGVPVASGVGQYGAGTVWAFQGIYDPGILGSRALSANRTLIYYRN